uniref:Leukemia NUP98 fusion partner 1 n=1 Tax=Pongo abelii TaxID=9601 RepID=A0A8I5YUR2_PONAB
SYIKIERRYFITWHQNGLIKIEWPNLKEFQDHRFLLLHLPALPRIPSSDRHPRRHSHEDQEFRCRSSDHLPRRHSHEDQEFRCRSHVRDYRKYSEDGSFKEPLESKGRSHSKIEKFSESFERQLCFRTKRSASLGPESRKERNERECLRMEIKSRKKVEEERSSRKEEHGEGHMAPLFEKGPE